MLSFFKNKMTMKAILNILNHYFSRLLHSKNIVFFNFKLILFFSTSTLFAQENERQEYIKNMIIDNKYYFNKTTDNALIELRKLIGDDKIKLEKILIEISELEKLGKVVLSTKEFEPIKSKVDDFHSNSSIQSESYNDSKKYAEIVYYTYVVITDLTNDKK